MKNNRFFVLLFVFSLTLFSGCDKEFTSSCGDSRPSPVKIQYRIHNYSMGFGNYRPDESIQPYQTGVEISPLDFVLTLDADESFSLGGSSPNFRVKFNWIKSAYACTYSTFNVPLQRVVNYEITSTGSFGEAYPPGTNIEKLFLEIFRSPANGDLISGFVGDGILDEEIPPLYQTLRLNAMPEDRDHIFTVTIGLDDGSVFELVSPTVSFKLN